MRRSALAEERDEVLVLPRELEPDGWRSGARRSAPRAASGRPARASSFAT
ncbi:MAG TPA: hypothetical protein VHF51_09455 [Solirubrobacteraceae bacterium]|nr:hypothetical protein [Solirubrobacteraceae bacterium]